MTVIYPYILHTPDAPRADNGRVLKALGFFALPTAAYGAMRHLGACFPHLVVTMDMASTISTSAPIVGRLHQDKGLDNDPIQPEITWFVREEGTWEWRKELPLYQSPLLNSQDQTPKQS